MQPTTLYWSPTTSSGSRLGRNENAVPHARQNPDPSDGSATRFGQSGLAQRRTRSGTWGSCRMRLDGSGKSNTGSDSGSPVRDRLLLAADSAAPAAVEEGRAGGAVSGARPQ